MRFPLHDFIETMCDEIRYKPIHAELRSEIKSHIEELAAEFMAFGYDYDTSMDMAASHMGNAKEIGERLNNEYRMPFNVCYGLFLWAMLVTAVIYLTYPLMYSLYSGSVRIGQSNSLVIAAMVLLFAFANTLYLKRGRMIMTLRDMLHISTGFLAGWMFIVAVLLITSKIAGTGEYYAYMPQVKIPIAFPYAPIIPKQSDAFAIEAITWWLCLIIYMYSVKSRRQIKPFSFVVNQIYLDTGEMVEDNEFFGFAGRDGAKLVDGFLAFIGAWTNKFGEKIGIKALQNDKMC